MILDAMEGPVRENEPSIIGKFTSSFVERTGGGGGDGVGGGVGGFEGPGLVISSPELNNRAKIRLPRPSTKAYPSPPPQPSKRKKKKENQEAKRTKMYVCVCVWVELIRSVKQCDGGVAMKKWRFSKWEREKVSNF